MVEIGKRFGKLVVISRLGKAKDGSYLYSCQCDCGKPTIVVSYALNRNQTRSCGCMRYDSDCVEKRRKTMTKNPRIRRLGKENSYVKLFKKLLRQAKHREIPVTLTLDQFKNLISGPCHYCGKSGDKKYSPHRENRKVLNAYSETLIIFHNGIDRLDPNKDYSLENCVPCCSEHNYMKYTLTEEQFLSSIKNIVRYMSLGG